MNVEEIQLKNLIVSDNNVRKTLNGESDETGITDLAEDIKVNGLINPITVRMLENNKYEIVTGQRRFLAMKKLDELEPNTEYMKISCNIRNDMNTQKAEEVSLVENLQRNSMTTIDKVNSYSRLYNTYDGDIEKVMSKIHMTKPTIERYIKIRFLPKEVLELLDKKGKEKISIDVAVELSRLPNDINTHDVIKKLDELTNLQKIDAIKSFRENGNNDIDDFDDTIIPDLLERYHNLSMVPSCPYVFDHTVKKNMIIPESMYGEIVNLIKSNTENEVEYC